MTEGFVTLAEAAGRLGISGRSLRRRILAGELTAWTCPRDRRTKLVKADDVERLATPRPIAPAQQPAAA